MQPRATRALLTGVFAASGFAGLVYESIWTQYLKLFLGHAAYAQSLVLVIFMGGLAAGSWLAARRAERAADPLRGYALAEAALGAAAFAFHPLFTAAVGLSRGTVLPALSSAAAGAAWQWSLGALLILPQAIVLGTTFPLMAAALLRRFPAAPGEGIGTLYFANSIGAVAGVLASGFLLVRLLGLPGTLMAAGGANLLIAALAWTARGDFPAPPPAAPGEAAPGRGRDPLAPLLLLVAAGTGAASFVYEVVWIRLLSLVLGTSTHAFELMLGAFILGLAAGSLWVRHRVDRLADPGRRLAAIQVAMGSLALATIPVYALSFGVVQRLLKVLPRSDAGYLLHLASSHGIALAVLLPAAFCAGTTLPLITGMLLRRGRGEAGIGAVYAANTLGGIAGVLFAVHVGMPRLGLRGALGCGAALDIALGLLLAWKAAPTLGTRGRAALAAAGCCALALVFFPLDDLLLASGVYRGTPPLAAGKAEIVGRRDGKTATVHVVRAPGNGYLSLRNNGKADAGLAPSLAQPPGIDEGTMVLLGALPLALHPGAASAANIGLGSGITSQVLLLSPVIRSVDTIEIEPAVVELARLFRPRNELLYTDPRSAIHVEDAKSYFSRGRRRYDLVISEPPNPWVSGVAGLFSREFYREARRHLAENGVIAQWLQLYEIDVEIALSILKAFDESFGDWAIYQTNDHDVVVVGTAAGPLPPPSPAIFSSRALAAALARVGVRSPRDLEFRRVADRRSLRPLLLAAEPPANSDYRPYVDQRADRARFLHADAQALLLPEVPLPVLPLLGAAHADPGRTPPTASPILGRSVRAAAALAFAEAVVSGEPGSEPPGLPRRDPQVAAVVRELLAEAARAPEGGNPSVASRIGLEVLPHLRPGESAALWAALERWPCVAGLNPAGRAWVELFRAVGRRDGAAMALLATAILERETGQPLLRRQYLLGAAMLGHLGAGNPQGTAELWARHRDAFPAGDTPQFLFRLLAAHAGARP